MANRRWKFPEYPDNWNELSKAAKRRDGRRCVRCGSTKPPLHAHHVISLSRGGSNDIGNLITLCEDCHSREHPHMHQTKQKRGRTPKGNWQAKKTTTEILPWSFSETPAPPWQPLPGNPRSAPVSPPRPSSLAVPAAPKASWDHQILAYLERFTIGQIVLVGVLLTLVAVVYEVLFLLYYAMLLNPGR